MTTIRLPMMFPYKGVWFSASVSRPPDFTTPGCLNVRTHEQVGDESARGGARSGTQRWHADQLTGSSHNVQCINAVTTTV